LTGAFAGGLTGGVVIVVLPLFGGVGVDDDGVRLDFNFAIFSFLFY